MQGESQTLDFKYEIADARKIARTFSAFANTKGGRLLIGVKDNGNISGIRTDEEAYMAEAAADMYCKPKVPFKIVPHKINSKTILEIIIRESSEKPHLAPWKDGEWKAFVRVDDQNFLASKVLVEVWKRKFQEEKIVVRYDDFEEKLFSLVREKSEITLTDYIETFRIKPYLAVKILANLISIDIIDSRITETESFYFLKQ